MNTPLSEASVTVSQATPVSVASVAVSHARQVSEVCVAAGQATWVSEVSVISGQATTVSEVSVPATPTVLPLKKRSLDQGKAVIDNPLDKGKALLDDEPQEADPKPKAALWKGGKGQAESSFNLYLNDQGSKLVPSSYLSLAPPSLGLLPERNKYCCMFCDQRFSTSQALGGHQNAHKSERATLKAIKEAAKMGKPFPFPYNLQGPVSPLLHSSFLGQQFENPPYNGYGQRAWHTGPVYSPQITGTNWDPLGLGQPQQGMFGPSKMGSADAVFNPGLSMMGSVDAAFNPGLSMMRSAGAAFNPGPFMMGSAGAAFNPDPSMMRSTGAAFNPGPSMMRSTGAEFNPGWPIPYGLATGAIDRSTGPSNFNPLAGSNVTTYVEAMENEARFKRQHMESSKSGSKFSNLLHLDIHICPENVSNPRKKSNPDPVISLTWHPIHQIILSN